MPSTRRTLGRIPVPARCSISMPIAPSPAGVSWRSTAVATPSSRLRRSSPRRAGTGPQAAPSRRWTKPRTVRMPSSKATHGFRSRQVAPPGGLMWPPLIRSGATRPPDVASRLDGATAWRKARRRADSIDRARRSPSTRSRIAASAASWRGVWRSSSSSTSASLPSSVGKRSRSRGARVVVVEVERARDVGGVERRLAVLAAAQLVAADRAAVVLARGPGTGRAAIVVGALGGPGHLVEDHRPVAGGAAAREAVRDPRLEAGLAAGGRGQRLDGGVEVAQVRRAEHDLGQQPVEGGRLEADRAPLPVDRGAGDPAAAAERVEHDVAGRRGGLEPGGDQRGRRRRGKPLPGRE